MSRVQQLIEESIRVYSRRLGAGVGPRTFRREAYSQDYGDQRTNATQNMKWRIVCGGCNVGWVKVKGTQERKEHPDCQGRGWRINKRFGRPV